MRELILDGFEEGRFIKAQLPNGRLCWDETARDNTYRNRGPLCMGGGGAVGNTVYGTVNAQVNGAEPLFSLLGFYMDSEFGIMKIRIQ